MAPGPVIVLNERVSIGRPEGDKTVDYKEILNDLAPCGLSCRKCFAYTKGEIGRHSNELQKLLGNFDVYAERFSAFLPEFKNYPEFKEWKISPR
jgi:hypothetical protein